ncbi:MAG TPA: cysteine dioxygenase family protein [Thermoleophilaceae bacterium]|jgi:predicted metal-dependent enzyme (double-stranded beta helix superfamily)
MLAESRTHDLSRLELRDLVHDLAGRPELWAHLVRHDPSERVYCELLRDDHVAVYLICWMDDHDTGYHDHDVSAGALAVASGQVREERLAIGNEPASTLAGPGDVLDFAPEDIHRVTHAGRLPAVTIHAYSPPLRGMGAYDIADDGRLRRHAQSYEEELRPRAALG